MNAAAEIWHVVFLKHMHFHCRLKQTVWFTLFLRRRSYMVKNGTRSTIPASHLIETHLDTYPLLIMYPFYIAHQQSCWTVSLDCMVIIVWQRYWPDVRFTNCLSVFRVPLVRQITLTGMLPVNCPFVYGLGRCSSCSICIYFCSPPPLKILRGRLIIFGFR